MKKLILFFSLSACLQTIGQQNLVVRRNQVKNITASGKALLLDSLILEDNATVKLSTELSTFSLIAKYVVIGFNVTIDGNAGTVASNGSPGETGRNANDDCVAGSNGAPGKDGGDGQDGADMFLFLRIRSIGSLRILANGSPGSDGGKGGNGGNGGNFHVQGIASTCGPKPGGRGGDGGTGGSGGNGGTVMINYTFIDPAGKMLASQPVFSQLTVENTGGASGAGGLGGQKGTPGKSFNGTVQLNLNNTVPDARNGLPGKTGKTGQLQKSNIRQNLCTN